MADLLTLRDAEEFCRTLIEEQVTKAESEMAAPNEAIRGDKECRRAFLVLLPTAAQRALFLSMVGSTRIWPRMSCLFGAPPFYFLMPNDAGALNAFGFSKQHGRVSMVYDTLTFPSSADFGVQYTDQHGRDYRIGSIEFFDSSTPLVGRGFFDHQNARTAVFTVKVRKKSKKEKTRLLKTDAKRVTLPRVGEILVLTMSPGLALLLKGGAERERRLQLKVQTVAGRASGTNTAQIDARIIG